LKGSIGPQAFHGLAKRSDVLRKRMGRPGARGHRGEGGLEDGN